MRKITFIFLFAVYCALILQIAPTARSAEMDDRQSADILQNMARTMANAKQFSVTLRSSYDALQANGQMVEFGSVRNIQVHRPDNLRSDQQRSDGNQRILICDGKQILVHNVTENVYARVEKAGSVDDALKYLVDTLNIPLPLTSLFRTSIPAELEQMVEEIDYVELDMLTDVATDHLAVRTRDVDFQIWIARGKEPLPRRIVISYKNYKGEPQFRADFSNWNLSANAAKGPFTYTPPKDAEQIPLLVRNPSDAGIPVRKGGAQ